jgi:DNA polymerase-3 subunit epsilon
MKNILLLDTETGGTHEGAPCIEVAVALYSVEYAAVVRSYSSLIRHGSNDAERTNRIPVGLLLDAPPPQSVWAVVAKFVAQADAIVAYNAEFDRRFVPLVAPQDMCPWVCAMDDISWPRGKGGRESLISLALAHDVGVASAHRAFADVDLLARLFTRVKDMGRDLGAMLARGLRPKGRFVVAERGFDEARNALVKGNGFTWDAGRREWSRTMAIEDAETLPFAVKRAD